MKKFSYILTVLKDYTYAKKCLRCNYPFRHIKTHRFSE